jgi:hypothetical protein
MTRRMQDLYSGLSLYAARYQKSRFVMTSSDRTCAKQRTVSTSTTSYHVNGHAFDAQVVPFSQAKQAELGRIAELLGFRWGGNFRTGDYVNDIVHFDDGRRFTAGRC